MTPVQFPEANIRYGPPPDLEESQCMTIHAYQGQIEGGSVDGSTVIVTAWKPSTLELAELMAGKPLFLSFIGILPPHFPCTNFNSAIHPQ